MEIKKSKSKIALMGFMGSGKSTLGKKLAAQISYGFVDLDQAIETAQQQPIADIFTHQGEPFFRQLEHTMLKNYVEKKHLVLSLGGGTPCSTENMALIKTHFFSIYLKLPTHILIYRLESSKKKRPLLENMAKTDFNQWVQTTLDQRELFYKQADVIIEQEDLNLGLGEALKFFYD